MHRSVPHLDFWTRFVAESALPDVADRGFEALRIGETDESADEAARMILAGLKTANCSLKLIHDVDRTPLPKQGALSVLEDGAGRPVAVLETTEVVIEPFAEIDDAFARAVGDWGGSLKSWRRQCRAHFAPRCRALGRPFSEDTEIVCERFRVLFAPDAPQAPRAGAVRMARG